MTSTATCVPRSRAWGSRRSDSARRRARVLVGMRTGDTPAEERRTFGRKPPDILVTTPESLYLILTSQAREALRSVRWVIIDEIHALASTKRGAHLALSLERLEALTAAPPQRIGLSATAAAAVRGRAVPRRPPALHGRRRGGRPASGDDRRCRGAQADGARGRRPGRGHGPARRDHPSRGVTGRPGGRPRPAHEHLAARSTRASSSSSAPTAARSSSRTAGGWPNASLSPSTSWPARSSRAPTTARSRASSAC